MTQSNLVDVNRFIEGTRR